MIILEVTQILRNKKLHMVYWQQEILAIKEAYKVDKGGIRSKKPSPSKRDLKKLILLKLQYDLVKNYSWWYCGLTICKLAVLSLFIFRTQELNSLSIDSVIEFEKKDFNHLISFLTAMKLLEIINYLAIHRWRRLIKHDLFISLTTNLHQHMKMEYNGPTP